MNTTNAAPVRADAPALLIIDDEPSILHAFRRGFRDSGLNVHTAPTAEEGLRVVDESRPDVVILDVHLPDASGLETFERIRARDARIPVILVTGHGTADLAIQAMKRGAFDYLLKPLDLPQMRELVARACASSRLMHVPAVVADQETAPERADALVGRCPGMQEVYKAIGRVAATDATVLILGETGTGKELVARAIYQHSRRSERPFLAINCAAIPENLLESELFGHEKGAFTGAERKRIGKFEQCSGGTLFLDEIGDMTSMTQGKLLRLLQEQAFERVGGNETVRTDVRLIAATNADLEKLVANSSFRSDLYFRFNVFTIRLPPLRERGEDLRLLVDYYVARFARELERPIPVLAPEAFELLQRYRWPGNVRELQSVLKQSILQTPGNVLLAESLPAVVQQSAETGQPARPGAFDWDGYVHSRIHGGSEELYAEALGLMEREVLVRVLRHTNGNQLQAARILGITRGSLRTKIKALNISIERSVSSEDDQPD
jgi:two-component system, NtrC family, response regulator AtoC